MGKKSLAGFLGVAGIVVLVLLTRVVSWPVHRTEVDQSVSNSADSSTRARQVKEPVVVQYPSPAPKIAPIQPGPTPIQVVAIIHGSKSDYQPKFHTGRSERMAIGPNQTVPISLSWPNDNEHNGVFIQAVHGGKIDGHGNSKTVTFGPDKSANFTFTPDSGTGTYEIVLRRGTTEEALSFWVPTGNPSDPPTVKLN